MNEIPKKLGLGKLKHEFLNELLSAYVSDLDVKDERVVVGSKIGEDAAVIDMGNNYLVAKTDPITFATDEIGFYAVHINVNDVVCTGATPKWFQSTILLPEKQTSTDLVKSIFKNIHDTCHSLNISVIGGHTEVTAGLERPIIVGSLLGEVKKEKLVKSSGTCQGDALIMTKGIFIEGTSIIGREKETVLRKNGFDDVFIEKCKNYLHNPGISIMKEALLANSKFDIHAMHDPTEGGLATGIAELAIASNLGVLINEQMIKIFQESKILSEIFYLDPLGTISSGSLLIAIDESNSRKLVDLLRGEGIDAQIIGQFVEKEKGLRIKRLDDNIEPMFYSEIDEILKIF
ncbi:MAG: AIR synthase family protein [Candidatus Lokiarchaeota archaeon]|nr:AIR synthase family protein [Candidatus Lokiarchaeota archaeon]